MGHATSARLTFVLIAHVPSDGVAGYQAYEEAVLPLLSEFGGLLERRLRNSDGTLDAEACVVAVQFLSGLTAVAARFSQPVANWIVES